MTPVQPLGGSDLLVPRLGVGTMTWGDPSGLSRYTPATLAYGGADGAEEEAGAFQTSLAAGVTLFEGLDQRLGDRRRDRRHEVDPVRRQARREHRDRDQPARQAARSA